MKKILLILMTLIMTLSLSLPLFAATETGAAVYIPDDIAAVDSEEDVAAPVTEAAEKKGMAFDGVAEDLESTLDALDECIEVLDEAIESTLDETASIEPESYDYETTAPIYDGTAEPELHTHTAGSDGWTTLNSSWFINILTILTVMVIVLAPSLMIVALVVVLIIAKKNSNNKPEQTENE